MIKQIVCSLMFAFAVQAMTDVQCKENGDCKGDAQCVMGVCVSVQLEERCPSGMHYTSCGTACPDRCNKTKPPFCTKQCVPGCVCDEGLVLDDNGTCVDRALCNETRTEMVGDAVAINPAPTEQQCGPGMQFSECTPVCPEKTCSNLDLPTICFSLRCANPGCRCLDGHVYMSEDRSQGCVLRDRCAELLAAANATAAVRTKRDLVYPGKVSQPMRCGPNEQHMECGTACEPKCGETRDICTLQCIVNVCQCMQGHARDANNMCIPKENCPK